MLFVLANVILTVGDGRTETGAGGCFAQDHPAASKHRHLNLCGLVPGPTLCTRQTVPLAGARRPRDAAAQDPHFPALPIPEQSFTLGVPSPEAGDARFLPGRDYEPSHSSNA